MVGCTVLVAERLNGGITHGRESHLSTSILVVFALSIGVCIGYILCAVMMVARDEQERDERLPDTSQLEPESRL